MSDKRGREPEGASRLAELKRKVERATKLISKLRETNYALTGELAELQRRVATLESGEPSEVAPVAPGSPAPAETLRAPAGLQEELQTLRDERKIIRAKVQSLLDRIEKLEL